MQQQAGGFSVKEMITGQIISNGNSNECQISNNKNNLLQNVVSLQVRLNQLNMERKRAAYVRFKVKQRNIFGLALIDMGNLVHPSIVSEEFWEAIGGRIN